MMIYRPVALVAAAVMLVAVGCTDPPQAPDPVPSQAIVILNPGNVPDCADSTTVATPVQVLVAYRNPPRYQGAGVARWHVGRTGSCNGFAWLVLDLNPLIVRGSDVCTQYGCVLRTVLSVPANGLTQTPSIVPLDLDTPAATVRVATLAVDAGDSFAQAWMGYYAARFGTADGGTSDNT